MFPEGGRSDDGEIAPLQTGVGLIVRRAGPTVRVVPAAVEGCVQGVAARSKASQAGQVRVKYGKPLNLCHLKAAEIRGIIDTEIHRLFGELRRDWGK